MVVPKTSDPIQINTKMPNPSQEPPASSKAPNQDLKDMDVLCTFKIKIESQNSAHWCTKDQWPYPNQDQDAKLQWGTSGILKSPNFKIKIESQNSEHGLVKVLWLYHNQEREPTFVSLVYQRPLRISKSRSRRQTPARSLQHPQIHFGKKKLKQGCIKDQLSWFWSKAGF